MRIICCLLLLVSCNAKKTVVYEGFDMENTIMHGTSIIIEKREDLNMNDIIAFKTPSDELKVLRVLGIPGDKIELKAGEYWLNGKQYQKVNSSKKVYVVYMKDNKNFDKLENLGFENYSKNYRMYSLSKEDYNHITKNGIADSVYTLPVDSLQKQEGILEGHKFKYFNSYYLGPLYIPLKNTIIDEQIFSIIPTYLDYSSIGNPITDDYFFCIGDNFPESKDSRFIGLIPRKSILGVVYYDRKNSPKMVNVPQN